MDIEAFHSRFFNVIARVIPGLEDLHYGLAPAPPPGFWGTLRRLKEGSRRLLERVSEESGVDTWPVGVEGLDVGCGLGGTSRFLVERHGFRMQGLNINRSQLALADDLLRRKGLRKRIGLTAGDARSLPFQNARFRLAVLIEVAFHIREKERLFAELARVLRPGGRVLLVDQELRKETEALGLFFFVRFGRYRELAEQAGFRTVREVDLTREVGWWMADYERAASWFFHAGAVLLALLRGGVGLAREYVAGVRAFNALIRGDLSNRGVAVPASRCFNGVRALRRYTRQTLENGGSAYKLYVLEKPALTPAGR